MTQWLRMLVTSLEGLSPVPQTHISRRTNAISSCSREFNVPFCPIVLTPHSHTHTVRKQNSPDIQSLDEDVGTFFRCHCGHKVVQLLWRTGWRDL